MVKKATIIVDKEKIKSDNYIGGLIIINYLYIFLFFRLIAIMMIIVIPMSFLFIYGIYNIISNYLDNVKVIIEKLIYGFLGLFYCIFSSFILYLIFSRPNVTLTHLVHILSYVGLVFGFAGICKAMIYKTYKIIYRVINLLLGIITVILCFFLLINPIELILYHLFSLLILLFLNSISRSMLYLSKFEISILKLRKKAMIKFLYNIIRESPIIEVDTE